MDFLVHNSLPAYYYVKHVKPGTYGSSARSLVDELEVASPQTLDTHAD